METRCGHCGFELWKPLGSLAVADLGLYGDSRFPGRSILKLRDHWEDLETVPLELFSSFGEDIRRACRALREATGSLRINVAILGNAEPHLHAHLIPRYPGEEPLPRNSPWDDPREKRPLEPALEEDLISRIRRALE